MVDERSKEASKRDTADLHVLGEGRNFGESREGLHSRENREMMKCNEMRCAFFDAIVLSSSLVNCALATWENAGKLIPSQQPSTLGGVEVVDVRRPVNIASLTWEWGVGTSNWDRLSLLLP